MYSMRRASLLLPLRHHTASAAHPDTDVVTGTVFACAPFTNHLLHHRDMAITSCRLQRALHFERASRVPLGSGDMHGFKNGLVQEPLVIRQPGRQLCTYGSMEWEKWKLCDCEEGAQLDQAPIRPAPEDCKGACPSPLTIMCAVFLAFNSAMAVYFFNSGLGAMLFEVFLGLDLLLLFCCLRLYSQTATGSLRREHLKLVIWLLTSMLILTIFTLLEFWFLTKTGGDVGVENGTASQLQHLKKLPCFR